MPLRVEAEDASLAQPLEAMIRPFVVEAGRSKGFLLRLAYGDPDEPAVRSSARETWRGRLPWGSFAIVYTGAETREIHLPGLARMEQNLENRQALVTVKSGAEWCLECACILPALYDFLAEAGHFIVHAGCLDVACGSGMGAVLLAGESGRGKTTTALALSRQGMRLLADDASFVRRAEDDGLAVWGLPRPCRAYRDTVALLPWLEDCLPAQPEPNGEFLIELSALAGKDTLGTVRPALICFLEQRNERRHRLEPLDTTTALVRLAQENLHPTGDLSRGAAERAFEALAELARQCRAYRLSVGPTLAGLADAIKPCLQGWAV